MAVQEQTPYIEYVGNGTTKAFPLTFECEDQNNLIILLDDVKPSLGDWYLENGSVIFRIAPKSASKLTMQRSTSLERTTNYDSYNNSLRPQAINKDFDRIWYALQEFKFTDYLHKLSINYAIDTAEEAKKVSNAATATANAAKDTADGIEEKVKTANATANTAKSTADAASITANSATTIANTAKSTADAAVVTANTAKTIADNATTTSNAAAATASTAKASADSATNTANTAKTTAEGIEGKVNTANSTASAAKNTADAAVVTANTAKTTADNATTTANGIDAKATQAQTDASVALTSVGGFDDRITTATIAANTANTNAAAANKTAGEAKLSANNATEAVGSKLDKTDLKDASTGTKGIAALATQAEANAGIVTNKILTPSVLQGAVKNQLNATGEAPMFPCRAWVNFSGMGTPSIKGGGNVASVVRNGVGDYTINFITPMPTENYVYTAGLTSTDTGKNTISLSGYGTYQSPPPFKTKSQLRVMVSSSVKVDAEDINIGVFC